MEREWWWYFDGEKGNNCIVNFLNIDLEFETWRAEGDCSFCGRLHMVVSGFDTVKVGQL